MTSHDLQEGYGGGSWARPGVKCVCINSDPMGGEWNGVAPVEGETYIFIAHRGTPVSNPCGSFATLSGTPIHSGSPVWICRFRPLISVEDDIAAYFEKYLHNHTPATREREGERA